MSFTCFVGILTMRSDIVCAQSCLTRTDKSASNPFLWSFCHGTPSMAHRLRRLGAGPILQTSDWSGKLWPRIWDVGRRSLHRHRPPQQPRISYTILTQSRLVRRLDSSSMRAGSPPSCQYDGNGRVRDLVTCHPPHPGGCHQLKILHHRAGRFGGALLGAPVPLADTWDD